MFSAKSLVLALLAALLSSSCTLPLHDDGGASPGGLSCTQLRAEWLKEIEKPALQTCLSDNDCNYVSWAYACEYRHSITISGDCGRVASLSAYTSSRAAALENAFDAAKCGGTSGICDCRLGLPRCRNQRCELAPPSLPEAGAHE